MRLLSSAPSRRCGAAPLRPEDAREYASPIGRSCHHISRRHVSLAPAPGGRLLVTPLSATARVSILRPRKARKGEGPAEGEGQLALLELLPLPVDGAPSAAAVAQHGDVLRLVSPPEDEPEPGEGDYFYEYAVADVRPRSRGRPPARAPRPALTRWPCRWRAT